MRDNFRKHRRNIIQITGIVIVVFALLALGTYAGSLSPSASPGGTMKTLSDIWNTIASSSYDSSSLSASSNGSLIQILKQINTNLPWAVSGNTAYTTNTGYVGIGTSSPAV